MVDNQVFVFGGTYRGEGPDRFRLVSPFYPNRPDVPLRLFTALLLPSRRLGWCHLYRLADEFCTAVELVEENEEYTNRVGAPGYVYLAEADVARLYQAYCIFISNPNKPS